jgi:hypothetical protein
MSSPSHPILHGIIILIILGKECKLWSSLCVLSPASCQLICLQSRYSYSPQHPTPCPQTPSVYTPALHSCITKMLGFQSESTHEPTPTV